MGRGLVPSLSLGEFFTSANVADLVWSINMCNMSGDTSGMSMLRDRLWSPQSLLCRRAASPGGAGDYTYWAMNQERWCMLPHRTWISLPTFPGLTRVLWLL